MKPLLTQNFRVSRHVSDAVGKGLSVKAEDRYQTMEALIEDLYEGMYVIEAKKMPEALEMPEPASEEPFQGRSGEKEAAYATGSQKEAGQAGNVKAVLAVIAIVIVLALFILFLS